MDSCDQFGHPQRGHQAHLLTPAVAAVVGSPSWRRRTGQQGLGDQLGPDGVHHHGKKAEVLRWCFAALTTVEPPIAMIVLDDFGRKADPVSREKRANLVKWAEQVLAGLERHLGEHPFIAAEDFTVADILMVTVLRQARRAGLIATFPRCEAYRQKCEARPAWGRTVAAYEKRLGAEPGAVARAVEPTA